MKEIQTKREKEKAMVSLMIALYCRDHHGGKKELCPDCAALEEYAHMRSDRCPFMETKSFCSCCKVHCYKPEMRQKIQEVMRYAGPRMLLHHPMAALRHVIAEKKEKYGWNRGMVLRGFYILLGCLSLALGVLGAILPLLPAFPFLLLASFCFGRSSQRLQNWFVSTRLYKNNLESYVQGRGMTKKTKIRIMMTVTFLMTFGFIMMHQIRLGQLVLVLVWLFHLLYFSFGIKTIPA